MSTTEGTRRIVEELYTRRCCDECGGAATKRVSYLRLNPRSNPASRGYGRDDLTFCSDRDVHICDECPAPELDSYERNTTFSGDTFSHMLLYWKQVKVTEITAPEVGAQ